MAEKSAGAILASTIEKIRDLVDTSTIIGEPIYAEGGTTIIPVSKVAFGFGAGGSEFSKRPDSKGEGNLFGGGTGGGVTISPVAFLVVNSDQIKLLPVSGSSTPADKLIDLVPELISKFNKIANEIIEKRAEKKAAEVNEEKQNEIEL